MTSNGAVRLRRAVASRPRDATARHACRAEQTADRQLQLQALGAVEKQTFEAMALCSAGGPSWDGENRIGSLF